MAATHSAWSMSLASFRAGHAVRVDAERAERGGREPAARIPERISHRRHRATGIAGRPRTLGMTTLAMIDRATGP